MCKILNLVTHPITYSNNYAKDNNKSKICITTLLYFVLKTIAIMLIFIYVKLIDIGKKACFKNIFNLKLGINYLKIFLMSLMISALVLLIMYITFYFISKIMNSKKSNMELYDFTIIMLVILGLGNLIASLLLYLIPGSAVLMYYTTFIYYSIAMITTTVKFLDIKEYDKFALSWTLVSLCIIVILIFLFLLFYKNIFNEILMII